MNILFYKTRFIEMKYANIRRLGYKDGINRIGIGDYIQLLAIDNIYN